MAILKRDALNHNALTSVTIIEALERSVKTASMGHDPESPDGLFYKLEHLTKVVGAILTTLNRGSSLSEQQIVAILDDPLLSVGQAYDPSVP